MKADGILICGTLFCCEVTITDKENEETIFVTFAPCSATPKAISLQYWCWSEISGHTWYLELSKAVIIFAFYIDKAKYNGNVIIIIKR